MEVFYGIVLVAGGITKVLSDDKKFEKAFVDLYIIGVYCNPR